MMLFSVEVGMIRCMVTRRIIAIILIHLGIITHIAQQVMTRWKAAVVMMFWSEEKEVIRTDLVEDLVRIR